jgi:hypothetical protein
LKKPRKTSKGAERPGEALRKQGAKWLERVDAAGKHEKTWLDDAKKAVQAYTGETENNGTSVTTDATGKYDFNILFSNVETIVPAVINSSPVPDIRRRFSDPDPVARVVSDILERAIRVQVDDSRLQVEMEAAAQDSFLAGRGLVRLRFSSDIVGGEPTDEEIEDAAEDSSGGQDGDETGMSQTDVQPSYLDETEVAGAQAGDGEAQGSPIVEPLESLANERIGFEAVSWIDYRHGPAKRWADRPWDAFRFCIPREDEDKSFDATLIGEQLTERDAIERKSGGDDELVGWEIWDKDSRKVIFIDDAGVVLKIIDDPLGLSGFFCIPAPMQPIEINGRLMPVNPFSVYRRLADDLDEAVRRKNVLIRAMKAKGWYAISEADMTNVLNLEDNEFAPIKDAEIWAQNGGIEAAVAFWPFEKFIAAIQQLDSAINIYKQWIYEITGISDIVRGASNAKETLGAQEIKSQWGSLRIQKMQRMMERCARDLFVMMAEIIPAKFSPKTLEEMTGIPILPTPTDTPEQVQQKAAVRELLKRKLSSYYRIDVESDSTVRADLTRQKQEVAEFLQGAASYFQAVAPLVQQGALPADAAVEIFAANARMFNLGRTVEDTLEQMVSTAKAKAQQAQGQPAGQEPTPEQQAATAKNAADAQKTQLANQATQQSMAQSQQEFAQKMAEAARKAQGEGVKAQQQAVIDAMEREIKQIELSIKRIDLQIKETELAAAMVPPPAPQVAPTPMEVA